MKNMTRRLLALFLALLLCVSLFPAAALAEGEEEPAPPVGDDIPDVPPEEPDVPADPDAPIGAVPGVPEQASVSPEASADLAALPPAEDAAEPEAASTGQCGDDLTWSLENGTLTISGSGPMDDYTWPPASGGSDAPWYRYRSQISSVVIDSGVTSIGVCAFCWCNSLRDVSIPGTVVSVGDHAFRQISSMNEVVFPEGVVSLGACAFYATRLPGITIPASMTEIDSLALNYCFSSEGVSVDSGNPNYCSDSGILFSKDMSRLIYFPSGTDGLYQIPGSVSVIENYAFCANELLEEVVIPAGVTSIGMWSFSNNYGLKRITVDPANTNYSSVDGVLYNADGSELQVCPAGRQGTLSIPSGVASLRRDCCSNCHYLTEVILPSSVTSIPMQAFSDCGALASVTIPAEVTEIARYAFYGDASLQDVYYGGTMAQWGALSIGEANEPLFTAAIHCSDGDIDNSSKCGDNLSWSFDENSGTLTISGTGDMWDFNTWNDSGPVTPWSDVRDEIRAVRLEEGVTTIGWNAFCGCSRLESVSLPASLSTVSYNAFNGSSSLSEVSFAGTIAQWESVQIMGDNAPLLMCSILCSDGVVTSNKCGDNLTWSFDEGSGVLTVSGRGWMWSYDWSDNQPATPWREYRESIRSVVLEEGVSSVGGNAFCNAFRLESVSLPVSLTLVSWNAFQGCSSLTDVSFAGTTVQWESIEIRENNLPLLSGLIHCSDGDIDNSSKCGDALTWSFDEESGVLTISGSGEMWNFDWSDNEPATPWRAYRESICSVVLEEGVSSVGGNAFCSAFRLESVSLPASLTLVGWNAYDSCSSLTDVSFAGTTVQWESIEIQENNLPLLSGLIHCSDGDIDNSRKCGDALTWSFDEESGVLTISGSGEMWNFDWSDNEPATPWRAYRESIRSVVVEEGVSSIGGNAFCSAFRLESVSLPASLTLVGWNAYDSCSSLTNVSFTGTTVQWESIEIQENNLPLLSGLIHCSDGDIDNSSKCGDNLSWSFDEESGLLTITGTGPMWNWDPYGSPAPWHGFADRILAVSLDSEISYIPGFSFAGCSSLTSVTIPEGVENLEGFSFDGCDRLSEILVAESNPYYTSVDGIVYSKDMTALVLCPPGETGLLLVPEGIGTIQYGALAGCKGLTGVKLPEGLREIGNESFYHCTSLKSIVFPESLERLDSWAFEGCGRLQSIRFLGSAPVIGDGVFTGVSATAVYPEGDESWTEDVLQDYNGSIKWQAYLQAELVAEGVCGDALTWTLDENGTLTVSGVGDMWDFSAAEPIGHRDLLRGALRGSAGEAPWSACRAEIHDLVLELGVASAGDNAFAGCGNLTAVELPAGFGRIGDSAFAGCSALEVLAFPAELTEIGSQAFAGCSGLEEISFQGPAPAIEEDAFAGVTASAVYPVDQEGWGEDTLQDYGGDLSWTDLVAFGSCGANLRWELDANGVLTISGTGDMDTWPLENRPWSGCLSLVSSVVIEPGVTGISRGAFYSCETLQSASIPDTVTHIDDYAFLYCTALESVTIPSSVTQIGLYAFSCCDSLDAFQVSEDNPSFVSVDGVLYNRDMTTLVQCPGRKTGTLTIPESVTELAEFALYACSELEAIQVEEGNPAFASLDGVLYDKEMTLLIQYPSRKAGILTVPEGVTALEHDSFYNCPGLTGLTLPESLTEIRDSAICSCSGLTSLTIPKNVTSIENYGVSFCDSLTEITFEGPAPAFGEQAFASLNATAYYPGNDESWTEEVRQSWGGNIDWVAYASPTHTPGDINGDGAVSNKDVTRLINYLKHGSTNVVVEALDVNGDGSVSNKDVTRLITYLKHKNVVIH